MRVIGTAGHVDHGKSSLITALSGINPDRLKEELEREMTIDLGFAWFELPDGEEIGVVDVPGHRDFIENMLAGIGGIDAAVLVIAADEGIMPQTREHLAILDLLHISGGVVALTKIDRVDDPEWISLVEEEIRQITVGTVFEDSPIIPTSSKTGMGLNDLILAIEECLVSTPLRPDQKKPRINVDRVFTMTGYGTVITGTLLDGELHQGKEIQILPSGLKGRIRGLQSHKRQLSVAKPGSRTAVNVSGLDVSQIHRGNTLTYPGSYKTSRLIDVHIELLNDATLSIKHNSQLKLFIGTMEVLSRVRLLGVDEINPGSTGWIQLELSENVVAAKGDRFIVRIPSPGETIGGGIIVDPFPKQRHRRFSGDVLKKLESARLNSTLEHIYHSIESMKWGTLKDIAEISGSIVSAIIRSALELCEADRITIYPDCKNINEKSVLISNNERARQRNIICGILEEFHSDYPLLKGIAREELRSRLKMDTRLYNFLIQDFKNNKFIQQSDVLIHLPDHSVELSSKQKDLISDLYVRFKSNPYSPPTINECVDFIGQDLFNVIVDRGDLVRVSDDIVFDKKTLGHIKNLISDYLKNNETITVAKFRDLLNSSRRYVLALLEFFDRTQLTIREGDFRRLKHTANR